MRDFKVGDEVMLKAKVTRLGRPYKGSVSVVPNEVGCVLTYMSEELDAMQPKPAEPPFAVGDFVRHRESSYDAGDGHEVLVINGDQVRVRFDSGREFDTRQSVQHYVKSPDQAAVRRRHAIARVERAQATVKRIREKLTEPGRPFETSNEGAIWRNALRSGHLTPADVQALLRTCMIPADHVVNNHGELDTSAGALINLAERIDARG